MTEVGVIRGGAAVAAAAKQSDSIAEIRRKRWLVEPPRELPVTTMLMADEVRLLHFLARRHFSDQGAIIDAGCFLGGSTRGFTDGLMERPLRKRSLSMPIQSYDLFAAEAWSIGRLLPADMQPRQSFRALFEKNIASVRDLVEVHEGDITATEWCGSPVELLFIDCAKTVTVSDFIVRTFFPRLIPGVSVVIQQDYIFQAWNAWIHIAMERLAPYFEILTDTFRNSVAFLNTAPIPAAEIERALVTTMPAAEKLELMARARRRFGRRILPMLRRSHGSYISGKAWFTGHDQAGHRAVLHRLASQDIERLRRAAAGDPEALALLDKLRDRLEAVDSGKIVPMQEAFAEQLPQLQALAQRVGGVPSCELVVPPASPTEEQDGFRWQRGKTWPAFVRARLETLFDRPF